jgi:hypothetical protein
VAGNNAVAGYRIYRQTFVGVAATADSLLAQVIGATASTFADTSVVVGVQYFYRVLAYDTAGVEGILSNESAAQPFAPLNLTLYANNPAPLYVNVGDAQLWQVSYSNSGTDTLYNLTVTTVAGSFAGNAFLPGFFTATLTGGSAISASAFSTSLAGPWTAGLPGVATADPLYLRWVVGQVNPGRSGILGYRTRRG